MNTYDFKNDLVSSIFRLMGRLLIIALVAQIIAALINYVVTLAILPGFTEFTQQLQTSFNPTDDPERIFRDITNAFTQNGYSFGMIGVYILFSCIISLIIYNLIYTGARNEVTNGDNSIGSAVSGAFDGRIVKYFVYSLLIGVLYFVGSAVLAFIPFVGVLVILFIVVPLAVWFSIVGLAAIGINNHSIGEAFSLAKDNMTVARIAKVLGIGILVFIVLIVLGMVIGLLSQLAMSIPGIGVILGQIIGSILGAILTAFMLAGSAGLYYRYTGNQKNEEQFVVTD